MRIAMISYHTCPLATLGGKDTGGMNVYVRELTKQLGRMGIHVDVFTRSENEHIPQVLHDLGYGNRVVHILSGPEHPLSKLELARYIPNFVEGIRCFAEKKGLHYDLIHSHYWMSGLAASALKDKWQVPVVHMFHTLGKMKNRIARSQDEMEGEYRIEGENEVLEMADCIVAATPAEETQLEILYRANRHNIVVIPPGVDTSHFYPIPADEAKEVVGIPEEDHMMLFVGRIEPLKGIDTLLRAISLLQKQGVIVCCSNYLVIVGGNMGETESGIDAEMKRLQDLCSEIGIGDLVLFLGKREQDTLPYYYSAADVVVVPSNYESFGLVALEAMACGTPVVASQVGGLAYLIKDGETGYVVPNEDPQALSEKLKTLSENPTLRQKLGQQANIYAQNYAWEKIAEQISALYEDIMQDKKVRNHSISIF
jgi:D-inositol-3-phosphate glycosyltransferase